ncbi:uncharacterized protein N7459_008127 [Penicillium hispanicum]|uniref:uncharacterized protein n=1 Tax=Penicillium hispanicum TaxID=1080232 RepID=UPI002541263E|nr:uncharacterized protein N7459_008127 [Penicillium hispanicum]KAJ5573700.1 hypothetical protein N7459_008127 [Penicillium hispanicum]
MFGSHTKSLHPDRAAQNGLLAALVAAGGYTGSTQALEAKRGWENVISFLAPAAQWEIARNAFKPFPCGIVVHTVIDGCVLLHGELEQAAWPVEWVVRVEVHPLVLELTGKMAPKDGLEGKLSVYHGGAVGLLFGKATPARYEDVVVSEAPVVEVRERIRAQVNERLRADECHVTSHVRKDDGSRVVIEKHVGHAVGSLKRPMTDGQLKDKFVDQCLGVLGEQRINKASHWCWDLENSDCDRPSKSCSLNITLNRIRLAVPTRSTHWGNMVHENRVFEYM